MTFEQVTFMHPYALLESEGKERKRESEKKECYGLLCSLVGKDGAIWKKGGGKKSPQRTVVCHCREKEGRSSITSGERFMGGRGKSGAADYPVGEKGGGG